MKSAPRFTATETTLEYESDDFSSSETKTVTVSETPEFDRRVRLLLGVEDQGTPVRTRTEHTERGWDSTFESYDFVTVECGSQYLTLEGDDALPRMLRRVEFADSEPVLNTVMRFLGRQDPVLTGDACIHLDTGVEHVGHITGLGGLTVYVQFSDRARRFELSDITHITSA
jgi:hypothetical protein